MARRRDALRTWPAPLATFDAADWPPLPGEIEEACDCASCLARFGAPSLAGHAIEDARRRWRDARLATLSPRTSEFRAEAFEALLDPRHDRDTRRR